MCRGKLVQKTQETYQASRWNSLLLVIPDDPSSGDTIGVFIVSTLGATSVLKCVIDVTLLEGRELTPTGSMVIIVHHCGLLAIPYTLVFLSQFELLVTGIHTISSPYVQGNNML